MDRNRKTPQGRAMGPFQEGRKDRADQSRHQYTTLQEFDKDVQQFGRELQHFRKAKPEPRVCVYGIPASVPFSRGGVR